MLVPTPAFKAVYEPRCLARCQYGYVQYMSVADSHNADNLSTGTGVRSQHFSLRPRYGQSIPISSCDAPIRAVSVLEISWSTRALSGKVEMHYRLI